MIRENAAANNEIGSVAVSGFGFVLDFLEDFSAFW
jgi:hypothetical protein